MDAEEVPYIIPFKVLSFILPNLSKKHKSLGAGAGAEGECMTVRELINVYSDDLYEIYYFDDSTEPRRITIDQKEYLSDDVLDLKVRSFFCSHVFHGIKIMVEKPSWV